MDECREGITTVWMSVDGHEGITTVWMSVDGHEGITTVWMSVWMSAVKALQQCG